MSLAGRSFRLALFLLLVSALGGALPERARAQSEFTGTSAQFYVPPAPLPSSVPGSVVRWQRFDASLLLSALSFGVDAYRVMYVSRDAQDRAVAVTGSVLVPSFPYFEGIFPAARPIIAFATGTQGMGDQCAPSKGFANSTEYDIIYARAALDRGWALAISDYQGLGTPGEHTYVVGRSLGKSVVDSVRALQNLDKLFDSRLTLPDLPSIESGSKVAAWGYSEGGGAAAWAAQLVAEGYGSGSVVPGAPSVQLVGLAAGGVPSNLQRVGAAINTPGSLQNVAFGVLVAAGIGFDAAYPELHLAATLNPAGVALVNQVRSTCVVEHVLANLGKSDLSQYTVGGTSPLSSPIWRARFDQNSLDLQVKQPTVPVFLYHGVVDEAVEYTQARDLARTWCAKGVPLKWGAYLGDHLLPYLLAEGDALSFLDDRLHGRPFTGSACSAIGP